MPRRIPDLVQDVANLLAVLVFMIFLAVVCIGAA